MLDYGLLIVETISLVLGGLDLFLTKDQLRRAESLIAGSLHCYLQNAPAILLRIKREGWQGSRDVVPLLGVIFGFILIAAPSTSTLLAVASSIAFIVAGSALLFLVLLSFEMACRSILRILIRSPKGVIGGASLFVFFLSWALRMFWLIN